MKKKDMLVKKVKNRLKRRHLSNETGGSMVEYGLIIGFTIFAFVLIIGIVTSIIDWSSGQTENFLTGF